MQMPGMGDCRSTAAINSGHTTLVSPTISILHRGMWTCIMACERIAWVIRIV